MDPELLKSAQWRQTQDGLAHAMGLSLITYGPSRNVDLRTSLCEPSRDNPICGLLQDRSGQRAQCEAHCGQQVARTFATGRPASFTCHANLQAFTVPITDESGVALVLLGGKAFRSYEDFFAFRETAQRYGVDTQTLLTLVKDIQFKDQSFLDSAAGLAETVCRSLVRNLTFRQRHEATAARLMTLFSIGADLKHQLDQPSLFRLALNTVGVLFNANTAVILTVDARGERLEYADGFGVKRDALQAYSSPIQKGLLERLASIRGPLFCDTAYDLLQAGFPSDVASAYLFPLASGSRTVLAILDTSLSAEDVRILDAFTELFSVVLENSRLRSQVKDRQQGLAALTSIMRTSVSALAVGDLFEIILDRSTECVEAEQASLLLFDTETNELVIKAIKGLNPKIVEAVRIRPGEGISGMVFAEGQPLLVADLETDVRVLRDKRPRYRTRSFISLPLQSHDQTIGVLNVADKVSGDAFTTYDLDLLTSIATYTTVAIQRSEYHRKSEELKRISITDSKTGLLNHRYFQERLAEEIERFKRHKLPFSLVMIDIDDFKKLNDTYGHLVGDEALVATARAIRKSIRAIDVAARYGGEEFTVILPQTPKRHAKTQALRIGHAVRQTAIHSVSGNTLHLTVSLGVASFPDDADNIGDLLLRADQAMYDAKRRGKNQVVLFESPSPPSP
ncbi:MAG: diguanylate cyclase [Nitrospirae bacterium]|nr:diguanylate cyclase [Nitrospirota bacterium]